MPKVTKEFEMVQELFDLLDELKTDGQVEFILELNEHLDPHLPFLEQKSEKAQKWLYQIYEQVANENYDEDEFDWESD